GPGYAGPGYAGNGGPGYGNGGPGPAGPGYGNGGPMPNGNGAPNYTAPQAPELPQAPRPNQTAPKTEQTFWYGNASYMPAYYQYQSTSSPQSNWSNSQMFQANQQVPSYWYGY